MNTNRNITDKANHPDDQQNPQDNSHCQPALLALTKAASDQLRLQVLRLLKSDSFNVQELCEMLDHKQSGLSHHLKILLQAGLVAKRREGNSLFYRRELNHQISALIPLQQAIYTSIDDIELAPQVSQRLAAVKQQRSQRSAEFFSRYGDDFRQQQEQVAPFEVYAPQIRELIRSASQPFTTVLELGPGEGQFLPVLAELFEQVIALDNSAVMLDKARQFCAAQSLDAITFIEGDSMQYIGEPVDCVVANMVLHHTPSPADMLADIAAHLAPGKSLFVTELCDHDQEWVQQACGDLWQGFEPEELKSWAANCDLIEKQSIYLNQLNGFGLQIRHFNKGNDKVKHV